MLRTIYESDYNHAYDSPEEHYDDPLMDYIECTNDKLEAYIFLQQKDGKMYYKNYEGKYISIEDGQKKMNRVYESIDDKDFFNSTDMTPFFTFYRQPIVCTNDQLVLAKVNILNNYYRLKVPSKHYLGAQFEFVELYSGPIDDPRYNTIKNMFKYENGRLIT